MKKLLSTILLSLACTTAFAYNCPSAGAIKAAGVYSPTQARNGTYLVFNVSKYDTADDWVFAIGEITANSQGDALAKGSSALNTLHGSPSVQLMNNIHVCQYHVDNLKYIAVAFLKDDLTK